MSYYKTLRSDATSMGDYIANELYKDKMLSETAAVNLSMMNIIIAGYIYDYISDCMSEDAENATDQH